jgi:hypothetical protein
MEDYAAKMQLKSDAALREYVTGYTQYREDAVLAAFDELRRRGQPAPEEAGLRPSLEAGAQQAAIAANAQPQQLARAQPAATPADDEAPAENGPALYSPVSIVLFTIMVSMVGGGVLLGMNLYRLGRKRGLLILVVFMLAYLYLGSSLLLWATQQGGLGLAIGVSLFNLLALLAYLLWFWPRYISGVNYRTRSVLPAILVCFLLLWGFERAMPYLIKQQPKEVQQQFEQMMKQQR